MEELNLRDVNFRGASFVETCENGTVACWEILNGGVNPGSVGFHLSRSHGSSGKTVVFYHGFWQRAVDAATHKLTFTRCRKNNPKEGRFPDQPQPDVKKVVITWTM